MENKPVFESFDEFVQFVYEARLNESENFEDVKALLSDLGLSSDDGDHLAAAEKLVVIGDTSKSVGYEAGIKAGNGTKIMAERLGEFFSYLRKAKAKLKVQGKTNYISYNNILGGSYLDASNNRRTLIQALANVNFRNAINRNSAPAYDAKKNEWVEAKKAKSTANKLTGGLIGWNNKTGYLDGSGLVGQQAIINAKGTLEFEQWIDPAKEITFAKQPILDPYHLTPTTDEGADTNFYCGMLMYYVSELIPGGGAEYTVNDIKPVEIIKSKTTEDFVPISLDADSLFVVNSSELKEKAVDVIKVAMNGLVSASDLVVTGYASQEGTPERNKTLCEERGKAIADFIAKTYPSIGVPKVEAFNATKHIQPASGSEAERPNWRKVTITGKGTRIGQVPTEYKEIVYKSVNNKMKADKVVIGQLAISISAELS
jgi:outer membrane protein OmpA-like peptidoglycan-associated protein